MSKKHKKSKSKKWFIKVRGSYLPNSGAGWLTYIPFLAYLIIVPYLAYFQTEDIILAGLITIPNWIAATVIMTHLAMAKS